MLIGQGWSITLPTSPVGGTHLLTARVATGRVAGFFPAMAGHCKVLHLAFFHAKYCTLAAASGGNVEAGRKAFTYRTAAEQMHGGTKAG